MNNVNLLTLCNMIRLVNSTESDFVKGYARQQGRYALLSWVFSNNLIKG